MDQLHLRFLGSPHIERAGKRVDVDTRKAIALLAYLAVTGQPHSRDTLAALLYPESDQSHARAALRRTLSSLKGAIGERLEADRELVGLALSEDDRLDVAEFRQALASWRSHGHGEADVCLLCLEPLSAAVDLARGDFLAGFTLRDSAAFDEWQFFETERLRRELTSALARLVRLLAREGQFPAAIEQARRLLSIDPLHEPAHRLLMLLYAWSGQQTAALRQYRECVAALSEELGVDPLPETTQVYEAIKEHHTPSPPVKTSEAVSPLQPVASSLPVSAGRAPGPFAFPTSATFPLVGRDHEWQALHRAYTLVQNDGQVVGLEGEAGIGKTRLAEELLASEPMRGTTILRARCYEGETNLAYGAFVEALRMAITRPELAGRLALVSGHWLAEAARLLPELAAGRSIPPVVSGLDRSGAQIEFFEGISQVLLALTQAGSRPGILFLDDLQWADEATLDVLTYLVRRLRGRPLLVLLAWRHEDSAADQRLRRNLEEAQRAGLGSSLLLSRWGKTDVATLVDSTTSAAPETRRRLSERLYHESEGLPLFVVEYLGSVRAAGVDAPTWDVPPGVRSLLQAHLESATETGRQLLATAAVMGRSFDFESLRSASGRSEDETVATLEHLARQGLIREARAGSAQGEPSYYFTHEQLRTLVIEDMSLARRRLLHRRVAETLAARPRSQRDRSALAGQIAYHYQLAGRDAEAAEQYRLAGEHARSLFANAEALAHFEAALALGHPAVAELHEAIGDLHTLSGNYDAALAAYETAAARAGQAVLPHLEHKLGQVHHRRGHWELADGHYQAALDALPPDQDHEQVARLYVDWSLNAYRDRQRLRALELARRALDLAEAARSPRALAQANNMLGVLARGEGDLELAQRYLQRSLALAEGLQDPGVRAAAMNNLALVEGERGQFEPAIQLLTAALALSVAQGDRHREAALRNNLADQLQAAGRPEEAMEHLKLAVAIFAEIGEPGVDSWQPEIWQLVEW